MIQDRDPGDEIDFDAMSEGELLAALDVLTDELRGVYLGLTRDEPSAPEACDYAAERRRQAEAQEDHRFAAASRWGNP